MRIRRVTFVGLLLFIIPNLLFLFYNNMSDSSNSSGGIHIISTEGRVQAVESVDDAIVLTVLVSKSSHLDTGNTHTFLLKRSANTNDLFDQIDGNADYLLGKDVVIDSFNYSTSSSSEFLVSKLKLIG